MKKVKGRLPHLLIIAALLAVVGISGAIAYMFRQSAGITNTFVPANVDCQVQETFANNLKSSVKVENTSNVDAYIRLRVVTYWQDSKGNIVAMTSPEIKFSGEWKYDSEKWIYDKTNQTFYHKDPVKAGAMTEELLKLDSDFKGITLEPKQVTVNKITYDYYPVVTFIAEAIQSQPAKAVSESWNVTIGDDGRISKVS